MEETCFCNNSFGALQELGNCLLERTRISLPVLVAALALGYIYVAKKKQNNMNRQVCVIEDDIRVIKKENLNLYEEIRLLKSSCSDGNLIPAGPRSSDKQTKYCNCSPSNFKDHLPLEPCRPDSRKLKKRKMRNTYTFCEENDCNKKPGSYSAPDVNSSLNICPPFKSGHSNFRSLQISNFEFTPQDETVKLCQGFDKYSQDDSFSPNCYKPEKLSRKNKPFCNNFDGSDDSVDKLCSRQRPCSSEHPKRKMKLNDIDNCFADSAKLSTFNYLKTPSIDKCKSDFKYTKLRKDKLNSRCDNLSGLKQNVYCDFKVNTKCDNSCGEKNRLLNKSIMEDDFCCPYESDWTTKAVDSKRTTDKSNSNKRQNTRLKNKPPSGFQSMFDDKMTECC